MKNAPKKPLILIADDRPSSRELLGLVLERAGYQVLEAENGERALEQARMGHPDLVLLDLQMPGLDGYGVLSALRKDPQFEELPVLALTASAMRGDREKILEAGFTDYLAKPASPEVVRETVARLLKEREPVSYFPAQKSIFGKDLVFRGRPEVWGERTGRRRIITGRGPDRY